MKKWRDKDEFKARVYEWATKLDVKVQAIALRPMNDMGVAFDCRKAEL